MVFFLGTDVINKKSPQDNLESCFYNHNELDLRNGFFREEEVFVYGEPRLYGNGETDLITKT
jgi:hypothetical protein